MIHSSMSRFILAVVICGWLNGAGAAAPTYHLQLTAAQEDFDSTKDSFMAITGSIRSIVGLSRHSAFNLNADIYTRAYDKVSANDREGVLLEAIYNYLPTAGFRKPTYLFGLRFEVDSYDDSNRDTEQSSFLFGAAIRTSDRTTITPGIEISELSSDSSDSELAGLFLNTDLRINSKWLAYLNIKIQQEDIETTGGTTTSPRALRDDFSLHHPGSPGGATTPGLPATTNSLTKSDSDNTIITLGANYSIDQNQSIDVSFEHQEYATSSGDFGGDILSLDYFYKF